MLRDPGVDAERRMPVGGRVLRKEPVEVLAASARLREAEGGALGGGETEL